MRLFVKCLSIWRTGFFFFCHFPFEVYILTRQLKHSLDMFFFSFFFLRSIYTHFQAPCCYVISSAFFCCCFFFEKQHVEGKKKLPFFQKHAEETESKRRSLNTTEWIIDLQYTPYIKLSTSALTSHIWSRSEWHWILKRWARRGVCFCTVLTSPISLCVFLSCGFFFFFLASDWLFPAIWRRVVTVRRDWLMRGATSVSCRKPESSHFTHRLRGIWGKCGRGKERK